MLFALYYLLALGILALHFTGFLGRHNLEWMIYVVAVTVLPALLFL